MAKNIREKTLKRNKEKDTRPYASAKYIGISPAKVAVVLNAVRGKKYEEAVAILSTLPNGAAGVVLKLVNSAASNAEHNKGLNKNDLIVSEIFAGQGPSLKRQMVRGKGSANRMLRRTSHITVILDTVKE